MTHISDNLKLPAKVLGGFVCLGIAEFVLLGMPGPCSFSGLLEPLFRGNVALEFWLAWSFALIAIVGALLSTVWWIAVLILRRLPGTR